MSDQTGLKACVAGFAVATFFFVSLIIYYIWENRRRDRQYGRPRESSTGGQLEDEMSNKSDWELESFRYVL